MPGAPSVGGRTSRTNSITPPPPYSSAADSRPVSPDTTTRRDAHAAHLAAAATSAVAPSHPDRSDHSSGIGGGGEDGASVGSNPKPWSSRGDGNSGVHSGDGGDDVADDRGLTINPSANAECSQGHRGLASPDEPTSSPSSLPSSPSKSPQKSRAAVLEQLSHALRG